MSLLNNSYILFSLGGLFLNLILSISIGGICLYEALKMCGKTGFVVKFLKYFFTFISVGFTSNFFVILSEPPLSYNITPSPVIIIISLFLVAVSLLLNNFCSIPFRGKIPI